MKVYKKNPTCPFCRLAFDIPLPDVNEVCHLSICLFSQDLEKLVQSYLDKTERLKVKETQVTYPSQNVTNCSFSPLGAHLSTSERNHLGDLFLLAWETNRKNQLCLFRLSSNRRRSSPLARTLSPRISVLFCRQSILQSLLIS